MIFGKWRKRRADKPSPDRLMPPEGVALNLPIAGIGVRMGAQITDILITMVGVVFLVILLFMTDLMTPTAIGVVVALLFFLVRTPYYIFTELAWNGQTLGKRMMKIKVVSHHGGPLTAHALVLRNLMKEAEVFLPATLLLTLDAASPVESTVGLAWIALTLAIPLLDRYRRRLGDMVAGTHVIHLPVPILLSDLASEKPPVAANSEKFVFLAHQLDHYGAFELQTLETILRAQSNRPASSGPGRNDMQTITAIVEKIRKKIGYAEPVAQGELVTFLRAFYNAQREHLEQRQLFGDRRENKHHAAGAQDGSRPTNRP